MTRTPATISLVLLLSALFLCGDVNAVIEDSESGVVDTVEELVHQLNSAILSQDQATLDKLIAADFTSGGTEILAKREYIEQMMTTIPPKAQLIDSMSVKLYGDTAVVTGLATAHWVSPAGAKTSSVNWVNVWVRGENGWQVVHSQVTNVPSDTDC